MRVAVADRGCGIAPDRIGATNNPDRGATFYLSIPAAGQGASETGAGTPRAPLLD